MERFHPLRRQSPASSRLVLFGAGVSQDLRNPLGVRGFELHEWFFPTRTFQAMQGKDGGAAR